MDPAARYTLRRNTASIMKFDCYFDYEVFTCVLCCGKLGYQNNHEDLII